MPKKERTLASPSFDRTLQRFPIRKSELDRFKFGKRKYQEVANSKDGTLLCLDVACGAKPFPKANVLCDLHVKPVPDRSMLHLQTDGKPFVLCNCCFLPFKDRAFDFVTSYYLIEHISNPGIFFRELKRVSEHGYVQCPSWFNELIYGEDVHNWIVLKRKNQLYLKRIRVNQQLHLGFLFHRLYRLTAWKIMHAILDETFHLFTVNYEF
ncbi:MAG: class I SAM-dependent methyltransferase [Candidatus Bathyarchaeota archaeon]|nr:class I SAM-dependent methyltransferase [Candidatus Bathyarchaeota archaeon]